MTMMKNETPISEIMTRDVVTLSQRDSLEYAEQLFKTNRIRHIPVVEGKKLLGMMSYTDLLRISFADSIDEDEGVVDAVVYNLFTIDQVMIKKVVSVLPTTTIKDVGKLLVTRQFHAVPVVEEDRLVGIVTTTDLINYLLDQF